MSAFAESHSEVIQDHNEAYTPIWRNNTFKALTPPSPCSEFSPYLCGGLRIIQRWRSKDALFESCLSAGFRQTILLGGIELLQDVVDFRPVGGVREVECGLSRVIARVRLCCASASRGRSHPIK